MNALEQKIIAEQEWLESLEGDLYDPYTDQNEIVGCITEAKNQLAGLRRLQRLLAARKRTYPRLQLMDSQSEFISTRQLK